jgi:probable lipoprotein NlpC
LRAAGEYQGIPYRYGGVDRRGLDCSGLVYLSFQDALGIQVPRSTTALYTWAEKLPDSRLLPGDLVFFNTLRNGKDPVSHVGIYAGDGRFIHAASDGPKTGVMYSALSENYWRSTYVGAGRVLPAGKAPAAAGTVPPVTGAGAGRAPLSPGDKPGQLVFGFALAPSWGGIREDVPALRGGALLGRLAYRFGGSERSLSVGVEVRPEWDGDLGIFRIPLTLSLGMGDVIRIFAGPALSLGRAALSTSSGDRYYTGGTSWFGAAGITLAPVSFKLARGLLSVYGEFAWQSYTADSGQGENWIADMSAGLRISTGLCYTRIIRE